MKRFKLIYWTVVISILLAIAILTSCNGSFTSGKYTSKADKCDSLLAQLQDRDSVGVAVIVPSANNTKIVIQTNYGMAKYLRKGDTICIWRGRTTDFQLDNGIPMDDHPNNDGFGFYKAVVWSDTKQRAEL